LSRKRLIHNRDLPSLLPVNGGEGNELDCALFRGTVLILPNGDSLTFLCPTQGNASIGPLGSDALPGDLPDGTTFVSAINSLLTGGDNEPLPGNVTISFLIPDDLQDADFAILYWDGSGWVDLQEANFDDGRSVFNGGSFSGDGHFEAITNFSGLFVLVTR
jgi:hypothetical protein